jgi:hypothetical protein
MKVIYKYKLEVNACVIELPMLSRVVCVNEQEGVPTIWVEQDLNNTPHDVKFVAIGTGGIVPDGFRYMGTCFIRDYVWHVYATL